MWWLDYVSCMMMMGEIDVFLLARSYLKSLLSVANVIDVHLITIVWCITLCISFIMIRHVFILFYDRSKCYYHFHHELLHKIALLLGSQMMNCFQNGVFNLNDMHCHMHQCQEKCKMSIMWCGIQCFPWCPAIVKEEQVNPSRKLWAFIVLHDVLCCF